MTPYTKEQKTAWARERRRRMKAAGYRSGFVKSPPKYSSVTGRISIKPIGKRRTKLKKRNKK
jgi:hypothetical protein